MMMMNPLTRLKNLKSTMFYSCASLSVKKEGIPNVNDSCKPPPKQPHEDECCGEGCMDCVWLNHLMEVKSYYKNDVEKIRQTIDLISNEDVKAYVKFEMDQLIASENCKTDDNSDSKL